MPVMNRSGLLSKSGLRRLLQSDEVWNLARKRNQVELVPAEQDIIQITESSNPLSSQSYRYSRPSQAPLRLIGPEIKPRTEGASTACQRDSVKTLKPGPDINGEQNKKDARMPKGLESCRGERFQHPGEEPLKSVLNIQRFTLDNQSHPYSDRVPTGSIKSSSSPEDLNLHSEDSHFQPKDQENVKKSSETKGLNAKNNPSSKNVPVINNNHDICDKDSYCEFEESTNMTNVDTQMIGNLFLKAVCADTGKTKDGSSCDGKSMSNPSEALAWPEEKKDHLNEKHSDTCSLLFAEKYIVVPEAFHFKLAFNNKDSEGCKKRTTESLLSEILSPVDEVLSYGSAELPPSVRGLDSYSYPAHPAYEIITWTSEEELHVPADVLEDLSINSENLPPLPADVTLRRRESPSRSDGVDGDLCKTFNSSTFEDDENDFSEYTSSLPDDVKDEISDPLSSIQIGDRVLVCGSRPGVLRYKGLAAFADGFWAGVALDTPNGKHNGTFRGVKYFSCDKGHGVLVRAEDVSQIHKYRGSEVETGVNEDPFSEEEPNNTERNKNQDTSSSSDGNKEHRNRFCPPRNYSTPPKSEKELQKNVTDAQDLYYLSERSPERIVYDLIHHNGENRHLVDDSNHSVTELKHESGETKIQCAEDTRKSQRQKMKSLHNTILKDTDVRKNEDSYCTPRLLEQWHQAQPKTRPKIKVPPHEDAILYRLVDAAVEILCGQANDDTLDCCETPHYLFDHKSRKAYRQVIFQLTSDVLHDIVSDLLRTTQFYQNIDTDSVFSALPSSSISVPFLKEAVRKEIQKTLNLERSEQHMTEMLQKLCKYWWAKRDRVDYILIQELHREERTWLDYTADQRTVKMRLTEEIFSLLLDDTISTLNLLKTKR